MYKDINTRKNLSSDELLLLGKLPMPIWVVNKLGECIYANAAYLEFVGATLEQEIGYGWTEKIYFEDFFIFKALRNNEMPDSWTCEFRYLNSNGKYKWLGNNVKTVKDGKDSLGYIFLSYDITERKRTEQALKQFEDHYRSFFKKSKTKTA